MQAMRREIDSFVAWKSFKYNDVIDSKIVNLDIWYHFQLLNKLSWEFELNFDSRSISSWVRRFNLSNRVESEDSTWVIELSQNVDMKIRLDDQFIDVLLSVYDVIAFLVKSSKEDDTEIDVIDVDFNSFVFNFLTKWFNIMFLNVMIMLSR